MKRAIIRYLRGRGIDVRRIDRPPNDDELGQNPFDDINRTIGTRENPIIFDVGANVGQSLRQFSDSLRNPIIHAFEPGIETFETLRQAAKFNDLVSFHNVALGAKTQTLPFHENASSDMSSFQRMGPDAWGEVIGTRPVKVLTLDEYCERSNVEHIDVLKIDTQGFDLEVLKGATKMLAAKRVRLVLVELIFSRLYESQAEPDEIYRYMIDHGFVLMALYPPAYRNGRAGWTDALFISTAA